MAWIRPTGFEDPADEWEDEANVLDDDDETFAVRRGLPYDAWSGFLVLTFPRVLGVGITVKLGSEGAQGYFDWGFFDGDEWIEITDYPFSKVSSLFHWGFPPTPVNKVRVRIRNRRADPKDAYVYSCTLASTCSGPLISICNIFRAVGDFFTDLAADIREVWVIGEYLATPFENLGDLFCDAFGLCCTASGALQDILDALEAGITPESLLALIEDNWPTLYGLITDPIGWFLVQLTLAFDLEPWHTQSLEFLAKWILEEYFPTLYAIWLDPEEWLAILLEDRFPVLYYLVVDPAGQVLYLIGQAFDLTPYEAQSPEFIVKALFERYFPELYLFARDPGTWLRERVLDIIREFTEDIAGFLEDAWAWLLDQYEDAFESIQARLYVLAEKTLRFFWEGVWQE